MLTSVEETVAILNHLGIVPEEEMRELLAALPAAQRPPDGAALIEELAQRGRLTKYQAQALRDNPPKPLLLSNYLLLDLLGAGGMGQVFKALHRRMDRLVALKVLHEKSLVSPEAIERFHREVKAAARLQHPHIVAAYDADEDQGRHFLVMEYVEGQDLATVVRAGPLPFARAVKYAAQAARALEYAHSEGVIHRDIKPANLLLNTRGAIKVLDMGIARFTDSEDPGHAATQAHLTQAGTILGTIDFMAPEQAMDSKNADERSDIYSLGCTLYYLLTGAPLHSGFTIVEKIIAHREREAPPLRMARPDAPPALEDLLRRMTARRPEIRIATMEDVASALETLLESLDDDEVDGVELAETRQMPIAPVVLQPQTSIQQATSDTMAAMQTNPIQTLERFIDGCAGVDGYLHLDEEQAIFRKGGELGLTLNEVETMIAQRCAANHWTRHSALTAQLKEMLKGLTQDDGVIDRREFENLIRHAVACKMPRRQAEEHCLTLMLDHHWPAKEPFWNRWFTRRCQKYGLE